MFNCSWGANTRIMVMHACTAGHLSFLSPCLQVGWVCQALGCYGLPFSPSIFFTKNGMGKAFFWVFALFPWNPLTKGVLDMSAAASNPLRSG